jgi:cysteine desulfurase
MKRIYLDNAATTRVDARVVKEMQRFFFESYGNASSLHYFGREAREALEKSRETIAKKLGASAGEVIFTSGGSESDNLALMGGAMANRERGKRVIVSAIEHPAVYNTAEHLAKNGFDVIFLPVDGKAFVKMDELRSALTPDASIVSVMHANNEVGTIQPIAEIAELCKSKGVLFHTDAVQSFTKELLDLKKIPADFVSISGHKIHGPKGIGALFVREGTRVQPLVYGGSHEKKMRAGTENVAGAVGFAKAVEISKAGENVRVRKLRDRLIKHILEISGAHLNGDAEKRLCNNAHFRFDRIEGEALLLKLDDRGIAASTGSACSSKSLVPSRVLLAMGLTHVQAHGSLRLSLSRFTTQAEVDYTAEILPRIVSELRAISAL